MSSRRAERRPLRWLLVYLALLAASHLVRLAGAGADEPALRGDPRLGPADALHVPAVAADLARGEREVRLAYFDSGPSTGEPEGGPVIVLLHGSPGDSGQMRGLAGLLAEHARVILPDLPGFGQSTRQLPDYSIAAHAVYVRDLLDELAIEKAHFVGFSFGGGVALHLAEDAPERIASLVLLASVGVQEHELLGQYHLNNALHGAQLAGLWLLYEATPHFGLLDGSMLDLPYARNFFDSDQRPLRGILERFEAPLLIYHGRRDVLVPVSAAREHHRVVPHSELVETDGDHFTVFTAPGEIAPAILDFVGRVEAGSALRRADASPERLRAAAEPQTHVPITGFALVLTLVLIAAATWISEDLTCIAAGLLVVRGSLGFAHAAAACAVGIFLTDLLLFFIGRWGRRWLHLAPLRWFVRPADIERGHAWFERRGAIVILLSRFLPGTRLPTYVGAGMLDMPTWWFAANLLVPVALWTPLLVGLARSFGEQVFEVFDVFQRYALAGFVAALLGVWFLVAAGRALATYRGRRRLVGAWRRWTRWEFWPRWAIYPPVVLYILWLGLRFRGPTVFTAANPGMPAGGGFVGESKSTILDGVGQDWVPRARRLDGAWSAERKLGEVRDFLAEEGLEYPVVLKPDYGERGLGVAIVEDGTQAEAFLRASEESHALGGPPEPGRTIVVQEYIPGEELGVFYVRRPGEERGWIFAITEKRFPVLRGDGRRTVERLILDDPRAVILAPIYLRRNARRLDEVPEPGEPVQLVDVGSHSGGTLFLDGSRFRTDALEEAVDRLCRSYEGFYFGRLDLRAPSWEAFRQGRDLKVLEINGVTSEATYIYDPAIPVWKAYRVLFEQWRLAFDIGAANRERGVEPLSLGDLLRLVLGVRRGGPPVQS